MVLNHESTKIFIEFSRVSQSRFPRGYVRLANSIYFRKSLRISSFVCFNKQTSKRFALIFSQTLRRVSLVV